MPVLASWKICWKDGSIMTSNTFWAVPGAFVPVSTSQTTLIGAPFVEHSLTFPTVERMIPGISGSGVYG